MQIQSTLLKYSLKVFSRLYSRNSLAAGVNLFNYFLDAIYVQSDFLFQLGKGKCFPTLCRLQE